MRQTYTYAILEVSKSAFDEIKQKLLAADYGHAFSMDGKTIDMQGIGLEAIDIGDVDTVIESDGTVRGKPLPDLRGIR